MNIKVFNIRLAKDFCQNDQDKMNEFLNTVEVKLTSTNFVTTGTTDYWSAVVFYIEKKKNTALIDENLSASEMKIFKALRHWRNDLAEKMEWKPFVICYNSHLTAISKTNPKTIEELKQIKGFGNTKAEKYGDDILSVLNAL